MSFPRSSAALFLCSLIVRIDEVEKEGTGKISDAPVGGNVSAFPMSSMMGGKPVKD